MQAVSGDAGASGVGAREQHCSVHSGPKLLFISALSSSPSTGSRGFHGKLPSLTLSSLLRRPTCHLVWMFFPMLNRTSACPSQKARLCVRVSVCLPPNSKVCRDRALACIVHQTPTLIEGVLRKNLWRGGARSTERTEDHLAGFSEICHS